MAELGSVGGPLRTTRSTVGAVRRSARGPKVRSEARGEGQVTPQGGAARAAALGSGGGASTQERLLEALRARQISTSDGPRSGGLGDPLHVQRNMRNDLVTTLAHHEPPTEGRAIAARTHRALRSGRDAQVEDLVQSTRAHRSALRERAERSYRETAGIDPDARLA